MKKHTIVFVTIFLLSLYSVVSYSEDFNTGTCPNWIDYAMAGVDCSNFNLQTPSAYFDTTGLISPSQDIYLENTVDFLGTQDSGFYWFLTDDYNSFTTYIIVQTGDTYGYFNDLAIVDSDNNEVHCNPNYDGGVTKININILTNGSVDVYFDDVLTCSMVSTVVGSTMPYLVVASQGFSPMSYIDDFYIANTPNVPPPPITGYVPLHTTSDVPSVVIDFSVEYGLQLIAFAGLIALVGLGIWVMHVL